MRKYFLWLQPYTRHSLLPDDAEDEVVARCPDGVLGLHVRRPSDGNTVDAGDNIADLETSVLGQTAAKHLLTSQHRAHAGLHSSASASADTRPSARDPRLPTTLVVQDWLVAWLVKCGWLVG